MSLSRGLALALLVVAACGGTDPDTSVEAAGAFAVGTAHVTLTDTARSRDLSTQIWYPATADAAAAATTGFPIEQLEDEPRRTTYAGLLAAAPACPTRTAHAALGAAPAAGSFPLVMFSHCHNCTRFSEMTVAERLASHGFVVVAVDHQGNTVYDHLDGHDEALDTPYLMTRAADIRYALDQVLAGTAPIPADVAATVDPTRVGMFGHSFGGVTAGLVAQDDSRIKASLAIAAPMDNPLIPGVMIENLHVPLMFIVAVEDNSITEIGNKFIRKNFDEAVAPAWKIEVADAGHWSFSDVDGAADIFMPGCGPAIRQTDGTDFTYLDPATGRGIAAAYVTAFFQATLTDDEGARAYLMSGRLTGVTAASR
ncbi:MAG: dienelactone hydrolase family protein [Deltaproteobacteria bacterium]|nr:dienelactone hydrolase family protein [Deltaproteobacteria bacterium]